ncbi:hypothetical protein MKK67_18130 [Methylobacterium sp. J-072]|uniref:hypothetical protein n=1 Tax=Methylobacterium sp. J-072 TaxID=2836651 RepID=UPI001FB99EFC|nr:hypothetical protein [Methylobacterium sp. J-072]MCJ2094396.1 hypothetical protein [Methylobacterium sp. J-072]
MIDITESREAGDAGEGYVARPAVHEVNAIIQAADRCLEAREAILQHGSPLLRQKMDELLLAIGQELALLQDDERPSNLH